MKRSLRRRQNVQANEEMLIAQAESGTLDMGFKERAHRAYEEAERNGTDDIHSNQ